MTEKTIGYTLLGIGLCIMFASVINMLFVFTGKSKPLTIVHLTQQKAVKKDNPLADIMGLTGAQQAQMQTLQGVNPLADILSSSGIDDAINLTTHFFLISFIMGFGYRIASLGTQLVRPIKVKLNAESEHPAESK